MKADEMFRAWFAANATSPAWTRSVMEGGSAWGDCRSENIEAVVRMYRQFMAFEEALMTAGRSEVYFSLPQFEIEEHAQERDE